MSLRAKKWLAGTVAAAAMVTVVGCGSGNSSSSSNSSAGSNSASPKNTSSNSNNHTGGSISLSETGSSLFYPLFNGEWISAYKSVDPNVSLTAASTGSGTGISQAIQGTVDIGASDAYLADIQMQKDPGMLNIPLAISAQQIMYNLPGIKGHLKMTGDVLAKIYQGKIKYWDDNAIKALNPNITLPHKAIIPIRRSDGSGDTFLFSQFLSATNSSWQKSVGYGTSISWPSLASEIGAQGNEGVVSAMSKNKYSIGYVGISWLDKATQAGLGYCQLQNKDGKFVLPTAANIQAAAKVGAKNVPADERVSLAYEPGSMSYPIINFEYVIIKKVQPSAAKATALKNFLKWATDPSKGNSPKYMTAVHFQPLPSSVDAKDQTQIDEITTG